MENAFFFLLFSKIWGVTTCAWSYINSGVRYPQISPNRTFGCRVVKGRSVKHGHGWAASPVSAWGTVSVARGDCHFAWPAAVPCGAPRTAPCVTAFPNSSSYSRKTYCHFRWLRFSWLHRSIAFFTRAGFNGSCPCTASRFEL